ncbi:MAG: ribosome maturation factor RimM [Candidatus Dadabacteria bacterium]|nr:ribosome maturation factor RimM [Candidatus Dadabacteria bacterium]
MPQSAKQNLVLYGKITRRHGLYGEVKVFVFGGHPETLSSVKEIYLESPGLKEPRKLSLSRIRTQRSAAIVKFAGIDTPEAADALKNLHVLVKRSDLSAPREDEYYWTDLIGLRVRTSLGDDLGEVEKLIDSGGHDILVIKNSEQNREFLVPFVKKFVTDVDLEGSIITVEEVEGLFE